MTLSGILIKCIPFGEVTFSCVTKILKVISTSQFKWFYAGVTGHVCFSSSVDFSEVCHQILESSIKSVWYFSAIDNINS